LLNKNFLTTLGATLLAPFLLFSCASGGLNESPVELPSELPSKVDLDVVWWDILGDEFSDKSFGQLSPTVVNDAAYIALVNGEVFRANVSGDIQLIGQHNREITAPLSIDSDQILISDQQGFVSLTDMELSEVWTTNLKAISIEKALFTESRIFVQTIDGRLNAVERITGRLLWSYQDAEPNLTVKGTSSPILISTGSGDAVVTGLANGKLVAINVADGSIAWEYRITRASGKTDVSRLVDVDAKVTHIGDRIIATAYQGDLVVVETQTGRVIQAKPFSTYRSIQVDESGWYGVNAKSHVVAFDPVTLEELWSNNVLEYHQLSEILLLDDFIAVSDLTGFLHVFDKQTGEWLASRHIDWRGAKTDPVRFGSGLLMQGHSTRLKYINVLR
jgi:outer membrane protein assembly factor BamB